MTSPQEYDGTAEPGTLKETPRTLAERVAIIEELIARPPTAIEARWTDEQAAQFRAEWNRRIAAEGFKPGEPIGPHDGFSRPRPRSRDYVMAAPAPVLDPQTARVLLERCVTVVKPGEILVVRLPANTTGITLARAREYALEVEEQSGIKVAFLPGEEFAAIAANAAPDIPENRQ